MSRVLVTAGAGRLGAAVARRLLADPAYDVRISDERPAPRWMREGCEVHRGDLRDATQAATAAKGCSHMVHLARFAPIAAETADPHAVLEYESLLQAAIVRAAVDRKIERLVFVSSPLVFERAELFPTPEEHLRECRPPRSTRGFARLAGERLCAAAAQQHGLHYSICRPFGAYGPLPGDPGDDAGEPLAPSEDLEPGAPARDLSRLIDRALTGERPLPLFGAEEQTLTPTHVEDLARGILAALGASAAANEDFNLSSEREVTLGELAGVAWRAGAGAGQELELEPLAAREDDLARSCPSAAKARELLGWTAQIGLEEGISAIAANLPGRDRHQTTPAVLSG